MYELKVYLPSDGIDKCKAYVGRAGETAPAPEDPQK